MTKYKKKEHLESNFEKKKLYRLLEKENRNRGKGIIGKVGKWLKNVLLAVKENLGIFLLVFLILIFLFLIYFLIRLWINK